MYSVRAAAVSLPRPSPNLRGPSKAIRLGQKILKRSFTIAETTGDDARRHRRMRTAWPATLIEFSDLVGAQPRELKVVYTPQEIARANLICELFSSLPYAREIKVLALSRARYDHTWRELATLYADDWRECRRKCDQVFVHLMIVTTAL